MCMEWGIKWKKFCAFLLLLLLCLHLCLHLRLRLLLLTSNSSCNWLFQQWLWILGSRSSYWPFHIPTLSVTLGGEEKTSGFETDMGLGVKVGSASLCGTPHPGLLRGKPAFLFFTSYEKQSAKSCAKMEAASLTTLNFPAVLISLVTPLPGSPWITHLSFYHPAYPMPGEDEWLWLKQLNNGKTQVQHRVNLTTLQNFLSLFPVSETRSGSLGHPSYLLEFF